MLFTTTVFLLVFFPLTLLIYFVIPKGARNYWLLLMSLLFYGWGEPFFVLIMIGSVIWNYSFAFLIDMRRKKNYNSKFLLIIGMAGNLSVLFIYKYLNFAIENINYLFSASIIQTQIILPIGISFFSFQAMSYVIDVYRGDVKVQKNPLFVALYISFFPQLIAGPIVRYSTIEDQIQTRVITGEDVSEGVKRFMLGFFKKVLLANNMAIIADKAFLLIDTQSEISISFAWLGIISYTLQIFYDFSGYSEMAIGIGRIFGFHFLENFDYPYIAKSITEFWRRWHMSLGTWFRDYVYFPLGGSRVGSKAILMRNLFVVWFLTGVWHGASWNFVIWGLLYFVLIALEKLLNIPNRFHKQTARIGYQVFTLLAVMFGWVLFRAPTLDQATIYLSHLLGRANNSFLDGNTLFYLREYGWFLLAALVFCAPVAGVVMRASQSLRGWSHYLYDAMKIAVYIGLFMFALSYLVMDAYNPFIYFNF